MHKKYPSLKEALGSKIIAPERLEDQIKAIRGQQRSIATINGSFDLLHAGHLHILYEASKAADLLIVALNTDRSIQCYKSLNRPIVSLPYRLEMMAALFFVDFVTWFDETDPRELLSRIRPDVHVNGSDWGADCIEAKTVLSYGGRIEIVDKIPGLSTTELIQKIHSCA
ncbi:MAG: hldC [Chlamydiales bacterium]|jgi:rfaE bifunctional protein nucleotidyltransferase chain/domain|nr:hldC [Chlamydiales bacterium]